MRDDTNLLGTFLRARRELVTPDQAGLPAGLNRRVPGLRREEVALLAGISADYYLRLERGRDRNPSHQVLEAVARALQLDDAETAYLLGLATPSGARKKRRARREVVPTGLATLVKQLNLPAFVEGRYFDVLVSNDLAIALSPQLAHGCNRLRSVFLDPAERALYPDWEDTTARLAAVFRESVGTDVDDPRFIELVGELSLASPRFRQLWGRHDVAHRDAQPVTLAHPQVGELQLRREKLAVDGDSSGLILAIFHPEPGSASAEKLALLASLAAPSRARPVTDAGPVTGGAPAAADAPADR